MVKRNPPTLGKVIWTDYPAFIAACIPAVAWIACIALTVPRDLSNGEAITTPAQAFLLLVLAILSTAICIPIVAWRLARIRKLFRCGVEAKGNVKQVVFYRDRGRVEYNYLFRGKPYYTRNYLHRNRQTRALEQATIVALLVNPEKPEQAIIPHLYV